MRTRATPRFSALVQASSFGNMPPLTVACCTIRERFYIQPANHGAFGILHSGNIGEIDQRIGTASHRACRRHVVGIDVVVLTVNPSARLEITGTMPAFHNRSIPCDVHGTDFAHIAQVRLLLLRCTKHLQIAAAQPSEGCPPRRSTPPIAC